MSCPGDSAVHIPAVVLSVCVKPSPLTALSSSTLKVNLSPRCLSPATARSRSRTNIAQEGETEASSQESVQEVMPEEVLVISLSTGPQTVPGMMSENEVMGYESKHSSS